MSRAHKYPRLQDFLPKMRTRVGLIPNSDLETKKRKKKTHVEKKNPTRFYYKEGIEQGYDKKTYPKPLLNI